MMKIHDSAIKERTIQMIYMVSMRRFLIGGLLRTIELDYKKIIAFSTIRQIRMIIIFATTAMLSLSIAHIFIHAIFKTILFCIAGIIFLNIWGKQLRVSVEVKKKRKIIRIMMITRVISITGIIFSSSFFTKDLFIENRLIEEKKTMQLIFMIAARFLTVIYRIKLIKPIKKTEKYSTRTIKERKSMIIAYIATVSMMSGLLVRVILPKEYEPIINTGETSFLIATLIISPVVFIRLKVKNKV